MRVLATCIVLALMPSRSMAAIAEPVQQCREADAEASTTVASALQPGLTFMWTTPVLRLSMLEADAEPLLELAERIARSFGDFSSRCVTRRGETANDAFFAEQHSAWEKDDDRFLAAFDGGTGLLLHQLRAAWVKNIEAYVSGSVGEEAAAALFGGADTLPLFIWASVHQGCSTHTAHVHENSAVSGVFYVRVPARSGAISFEDPRGTRPPFARNRLHHDPIAGELLLFPPWLVHGVTPSCELAPGEMRISLSFNVVARDKGGKGAVPGATDWELLADSSFLADGSG